MELVESVYKRERERERAQSVVESVYKGVKGERDENSFLYRTLPDSTVSVLQLQVKLVLKSCVLIGQLMHKLHRHWS